MKLRQAMMTCLIVFALLLFSSSVFCEGVDPLIAPCPLDDLACLSKSSDDFLVKAVGGIGEPYNIKPLEPLEVSALELPGCCNDPPSLIFHQNNIKIYGLSTAKLTGFRMDQETKVLNINMTVTYRMVSDIIINSTKSYSGTVEIKNAKVAVTTTYGFVLEKDDKGEHLVIGPETTTCEPMGDPEVVFNDALEEALKNDAEFMAKKEKNSKQLSERRKNIACRINVFAFPKLIEGWRRATRVMTTSHLFTNQIGN